MKEQYCTMTQIEKDAMHERCVEHIRAHEYEKALGIALKLLDQDPEDAAAMFQIAKCMLDQDRHGIAYNLMARAVKLRPDIPEMWLQYGQTHGETPDQWKRPNGVLTKHCKSESESGKK